jgi:dephospho-CoA kinase
MKVGVTGGIGSGKSEVSRVLAGCGAVLVDADEVAREVVAPGSPGLAAVLAAFGEDMARPDGSLDRQRLGRVVFADQALRRRLNDIVHPLIERRTAQLFAAVPPDAVVVHDVPLLVENDLVDRYDFVVVVEAPVADRVARVVARTGLGEDEVLRRIAAQADDASRRKAADVVITNGGTVEELHARSRQLWNNLQGGEKAVRRPTFHSK